VVCFQVKFEVFEQPVFAQEVQTGCSVKIVLMLGWFLGFGLDVEGPLEAGLFFLRACTGGCGPKFKTPSITSIGASNAFHFHLFRSSLLFFRDGGTDDPRPDFQEAEG
jgi:hypothetical protein